MRDLTIKLEPRTLRHLGQALIARADRAESVELAPRRSLTAEGAEQLADILAMGSQPTIGWWKRELARQAEGVTRGEHKGAA